eukprot:sb/3476626/
MNGSPIEDKVEMLNSTLHSMPTISGGEDRLTAIENRLKAIQESTDKTQKQVRTILTIIQSTLSYPNPLVQQLPPLPQQDLNSNNLGCCVVTLIYWYCAVEREPSQTTRNCVGTVF